MRSPPSLLLAATLSVVACGAWESSPTQDSTNDAAPPPSSDRPVVLGFARAFHSEILGETRHLRIHVPGGYTEENQQDHALLVLSDGPWDFRVAASLVRSLSIVEAIPPMVVVGIPNPNRNRDLIPFEASELPGSGGGADYLESLASEILPYVDAQWPTNGFRVFSGHSLGGLTAIHVLTKRPDLFDGYIALSPSLEVGEGVMLQRWRSFARGREALDKRLYLAVGDEFAERPYFDELVASLRDEAPTGLRWEADIFDADDDHDSMRVTGAVAGIRWIFRDWRLRSPRLFDMTFEEIEAHYTEATRRYEQPRRLTASEVTRAAYWGLTHRDRLPRAMELSRYAVARWPDEAETHAALSATLEADGRPREALSAIEHAIQLASATSPDHVPIYRQVVRRLRGELDGRPR